MPLLSAEQKALSNAGVALPDPAQIAVEINSRWRRPLLCTTESLLLVCPRNGNDGEGQHPHPLWDEITLPVQKLEDGLRVRGVGGSGRAPAG